MLKRYGTCWSELNRLLYWDPVKHVALGVMHNWYKGVLQHHWRVRWAFEPKLTQHDAHNDQLENVEDSDLDKSSSSCHFQDTALLNIRKVITNIVVPLGVTQVSPNLGDPKHGKLKATKWHSLFATYLSVYSIFSGTTQLADQRAGKQRCCSTSPRWWYARALSPWKEWRMITATNLRRLTGYTQRQQRTCFNGQKWRQIITMPSTFQTNCNGGGLSQMYPSSLANALMGCFKRSIPMAELVILGGKWQLRWRD